MNQLSHLHLGYLHFNQVLCSTAVPLINLIIRWYTLDTLWRTGCERLVWALLHERSPVSISQWYCIWGTAGSLCLSNLSLQLCWNRQHASLISHAVSTEKRSLGVLDQRAIPYSLSCSSAMHKQKCSERSSLKDTIKAIVVTEMVLLPSARNRQCVVSPSVQRDVQIRDKIRNLLLPSLPHSCQFSALLGLDYFFIRFSS